MVEFEHERPDGSVLVDRDARGKRGGSVITLIERGKERRAEPRNSVRQRGALMEKIH